ncbi:MAG: molybdopterin-binding protein [Chloroflexi bacterium]|nr:molybdopterin-binding protein [Chloroflexota bacterium]
MAVDIEIICIGNELLIGKVQNTNAHWLGTQATALGANVKRVTAIQDIVEEIASTINEAIARKPQFIITTGGLGPTFDDKTFQGIAAALNQKLVVNSEALEMVRAKCVEYAMKRQMLTEIEMTPPRVKMAIYPEKTQPVVNPIGTAPGLRVEVGCTVLFALPGVPREMEAIFNQTIAPLIKQAVGNGVFCEKSLFADNIFESRLAPLIDKVMAENKGVYVKSHPMRTENKPGIELHLTIAADKEQNPAEKLLKASKELAVLIEANGGLVTAEF